MKISALLAITAVSITILSCKKDEKATHIEGVGTPAQPTTANQNNPVMVAPGSNSAIANITPVSPQQVAAAGAANVNPAHGQPGHRCDIAVGAPLNGNTVQPVANNTQPQPIKIDPASMKVQQNNQTQKTKPGMNPPHGEPGHRCDIAVGEPLSTPVKATPTATTTPSAAPAKALPTTVAAPQIANNSGPKPKLNPAHGEPWHDCAIAVGEPLK